MRKEKPRGALWLALYIAAVVLLYAMDALSSLNLMLQDALYQHPAGALPQIYVIGVDDKSLDKLGPWNSWPRSTMADMINLLNADEGNRPAVIGVDVMYFGESEPLADNALREAVEKADNVVLASQLRSERALVMDANQKYHWENTVLGMDIPYLLPDTPVSHGFTNVQLDSDGVVRRSQLTATVGGELQQNFALAVYRTYIKNTGAASSPLPPVGRNGMWNIPYSARPGAYGNGLSFSDVLDGEISPALFKDGVVIIGAYASGMLDSYYTPVDKSVPMFGAEINANMVQALMAGRYKRDVPLPVQMALLAAVLCVCGVFFYRRDMGAAALMLVLCTAGFLCAALLCYARGYILAPLYVPLSAAVLYIVRVVRGFLTERQERLQTLQTFQRYVSPSVASHLLAEGSSALSDSVRRHIAVMFIDIRGFTPLSESMTPEQVAQILDEYLTLTSTAIFRNGGTVDKFIGDATMALFNAPLDQEDYVYCAVKTAMEIVEGGEKLRESLMERFGKSVRFGIGVHCGDAVVGNIGAPFRMDYTAIGDTVNTSARLESVAGPGQVLVSKQICRALEGRITVHFVGLKALKGKSEPAELYQVDALTPPQTSSSIPSQANCAPGNALSASR